MIKITILGILLTAVTVIMHTAGTVWWIYFSQKIQDVRPMNFSKGVYQIFRVILATAFVLLLLHFAEVTVWALVYVWIPNVDTPDTFEEAIYFSMVTFTSLGYGDVVIQNSWRLLASIQAVAGTFVFGWSSALLFAALLRLLEPLDELAEDLRQTVKNARTPGSRT